MKLVELGKAMEATKQLVDCGAIDNLREPSEVFPA